MLYIIRHGQTELNSKHALQGRSDHPLNAVGVQQARDAAQKLQALGTRFDRVYSSPLVRAVQTARIVAPSMEPIIDGRLIEMDYGPYECADLNNLPTEILEFFKDFAHNPAPEGMEQLASVVERVGRFLEEIKGFGGDILISTHAIAMKGALEYLTPESRGTYWSKYIGNCTVYAAESKTNGFGIPYELRME